MPYKAIPLPSRGRWSGLRISVAGIRHGVVERHSKTSRSFPPAFKIGHSFIETALAEHEFAEHGQVDAGMKNEDGCPAFRGNFQKVILCVAVLFSQDEPNRLDHMVLRA